MDQSSERYIISVLFNEIARLREHNSVLCERNTALVTHLRNLNLQLSQAHIYNRQEICMSPSENARDVTCTFPVFLLIKCSDQILDIPPNTTVRVKVFYDCSIGKYLDDHHAVTRTKYLRNTFIAGVKIASIDLADMTPTTTNQLNSHFRYLKEKYVNFITNFDDKWLYIRRTDLIDFWATIE